MKDPINEIRPNDITCLNSEFLQAIEMIQGRQIPNGELPENIKTIVACGRFLAAKYSISEMDHDFAEALLRKMKVENDFAYRGVARRIGKILDSKLDNKEIILHKEKPTIFEGFSFSLDYQDPDALRDNSGNKRGAVRVKLDGKDTKFQYVIVDAFRQKKPKVNRLDMYRNLEETHWTILSADEETPISKKIYLGIEDLLKGEEQIERVELCVQAGQVLQYRIYKKGIRQFDSVEAETTDESPYREQLFGKFPNFEENAVEILTVELKQYLNELKNK